jgi:hypothetical protein
MVFYFYSVAPNSPQIDDPPRRDTATPRRKLLTEGNKGNEEKLALRFLSSFVIFVTFC